MYVSAKFVARCLIVSAAALPISLFVFCDALSHATNDVSRDTLLRAANSEVYRQLERMPDAVQKEALREFEVDSMRALAAKLQRGDSERGLEQRQDRDYMEYASMFAMTALIFSIWTAFKASSILREEKS